VLESAVAAADYDHLSAGGTAIQYADIQAIQGQQNLVLPSSMLGIGMHICTAYISLATLLSILHPFTLNMQTLLDEWVGAKMELPGLLAPIPQGPAACVFWMSLQFHYFFHSAQMQPDQGPPTMPCMTELTKKIRLHIFAQMALALPLCYLPTPIPATQPAPAQNAPRATLVKGGTTWVSTRVQNPKPNSIFCPYNRVGRLGTTITRHSVPTNTAGMPMCLSFHMQNACNSNCPCAVDHQTHMAAEDAAILAWA